MILVLFFALTISFVLIFILRGSAPDIAYQNPQSPKIHRLGELPTHEDGSHRTSPALMDAGDLEKLKMLSLNELEQFCMQIIEKTGLKFQSIDRSEGRAFHLLTSCEMPFLRGE